MTTIYFMRHSEAVKVNGLDNCDSLQLQNEKCGLTERGEAIALDKSKRNELQKFDVVISSNYTRAIDTAKYFTTNKIIIDLRFGERKFGVNSWNEIPDGFEERQFNDFNYKISNGESLNDVFKREDEALKDVLHKYEGKKILVVGHSTALAVLFSKWCEVSYDNPYTYNGSIFFDGKWNYCETFKLEFDNTELKSIKNIR